MTYRSGVTISVWVFADPDEPNDSFWLPLSGLGYSTIDDRGFLVRKNNNPATDVQWFPGQPEPGDPGWNWNTYYGVFASAYTRDGWSGNEVYETVWYNTGNIPNQPPIIPCWTSVWMGVADPKNGQAQLQLVWIFQWWLHIGHSWAPDVAVNYVSSDKTVVGQGCSLNINVTVENPGNCSETFDVTLYANTTPIGNITVTDLPNDTFAVFVFVWNTTGFANGNYTLSAYAWPVPDETNTDNNNFTDGWTMVSIIGDITGPLGSPDSKVDMRDVGHVAKRFGTDPSKPLWDANDDITGPTIGLPDGKIDMRDIALVARHFGEHYP